MGWETGGGGGIYNTGGGTSSSPVLQNVTISHNQAGRHAGGLYISGQSVAKFHDVLITENKAGSSGGGTYIQGAQPEFRRVTISKNSASAGGGMYNTSSANPQLLDVDISGNKAGVDASTGSGGGVYNDAALPFFQNVTIRDNSAGAAGGGIMNRGTTYGLLSNVLITGNIAGNNGGGIYNWMGSRPTLINVTLAGNKSTHPGGAIFNNENAGLIIRSSILWGNSSGIANATQSGAMTITYSLVQGRTQTDNWNISSEGIPIDGNSIFKSPISYESAPTKSGNYTLKPDAPVIDKGDPDINLTFYPIDEDDKPIDIAGNERVYGISVDLGAYELTDESPYPVLLATFNATLQENITLLNWQTTEEINASHFEVERSKDGNSFRTIGSITAKGESKGIISYSFTDPNLSLLNLQNIWYYRLKMIDHDGTFEYSPIVVAQRRNENGPSASIYPNPAVHRVYIKQIDWNNLELLKLFNPMGNEVPVQMDKSTNSLNISHLPVGHYLLRIETKNSPSQTFRLVVGR